MLASVKSWIAKNKYRKTAYFFFSFPYRIIKYYFRIIKCKRRGENALTTSSINKRTGRVYVLGSGGSVNNIELWTKIREHDSIEFNFWVLHAFVPDTLFLEIPRSKNRHKAIVDALRKRAAEYKKTSVVIVDDQEISNNRQLKALFGAYFKYVGLVVSAPSVSVYRSVARVLFSLSKHSDRLFCEGGSSVDRIISYCILRGYKEIVLCGIDLNNVNYFYEDLAFVSKDVCGCVPTTDQEGRAVHKTNDPSELRMGITVEESIIALLPLCYSRGVKLYIENPESALAKILPVLKH